MEPEQTTTEQPERKNPPQESFFQSRRLQWVIGGIAAVIVLLLVFQAGVFVGLRKARFSYRWGEQYHQVFGGPRGGFMADLQGQDFISGHGTAGTVIKIDGNNIVIKGNDGVEKNVMVTDDTTIEKGRAMLKVSDIKVDDNVVVIGTPEDNGSIQAKLIRVFDTAAANAPFHIGPTPLFK